MLFFRRLLEYRRDNAYNALLMEKYDEDISPISPSQQVPTKHWTYVVPKKWLFSYMALMGFNTVLFCVLLGLISSSNLPLLGTKNARNLGWRKANQYSPIIDDIDIPMETRRMKGTFVDYDHDIFRQPPSPAVDAAWDELSEHGISYVTREQALKMGWDIDVVANLSPEFGVGSDKYAGETDMIHKIHCLNMVRKDVYFDYYWGDMYPDRQPSELHQIHTSHCLYILLQALMCDANTDLIPHVYIEDFPNPVPNFQINRKCGNYDGVRDWVNKNSVPFNMTVLKMLDKPPGQKVWPMMDEFRRVFRVDE